MALKPADPRYKEGHNVVLKEDITDPSSIMDFPDAKTIVPKGTKGVVIGHFKEDYIGLGRRPYYKNAVRFEGGVPLPYDNAPSYHYVGTSKLKKATGKVNVSNSESNAARKQYEKIIPVRAQYGSGHDMKQHGEGKPFKGSK